MDFRLVDTGWDRELESALIVAPRSIRVISPFIKATSAERLLRHGRPADLQVVTRFNLDDFSEGVSDIAALRLLLSAGARVRGIRNLHAKLYLFGNERVLVTSANLTESGLTKNHEFGFAASEAGIVTRCRQYFERLWERAGPDLTADQLVEWERVVTDHQAHGAPVSGRTSLGDHGADAGLPPLPVPVPLRAAEAGQAFVKLFGEGHKRAEHSTPVVEEVDGSGCHWACTYPRGKRPRRVRDGALIFMAHLVRKPKDILVFGRATGLQHREGRDDASSADLERRSWKEKWPHYVRVHHAEFVAGTLANGVSLNELMDALGADAFASTQRNEAAGEGNTNPRSALRQQAQVELSPQGRAWLNDRLERAFAEHGRLPADTLAALDWPDVTVTPDALAP